MKKDKKNKKEPKIKKELAQLQMLDVRLAVAHNLMQVTDPQGRPYFDVQWIVEKILKLGDAKVKKYSK